MDINSTAELLRDCFLSITSNWLSRRNWNVRYDAGGEISTSVDTMLEAELKLVLAGIRPQAAFLAEEEFKLSGKSLHKYAACEELWIVDPLDGTSNFVAGSDDFGLLVAYARRGIATCGWILVPRRNVVCSAELGAGTWINGKRCIQLQPRREARFGILATGDFTASELTVAEKLRATLEETRGTRACAIDYIDLIVGVADVALYKRTRPWDHAAGVLAFSETGGHHMTFSGESYQVLNDNQGLLLASSEPSLKIAANLLDIGIQ